MAHKQILFVRPHVRRFYAVRLVLADAVRVTLGPRSIRADRKEWASNRFE
jgi:hypothetical protein